MRFSAFEEKLVKKIAERLPGAAPGIQVQVHQQGRKICDIAVGETFAYYDLASITKAFFTATALMKAYDEGKWKLDTKVSELLPWFPHSDVLVVNCLTHTSGLPWWHDFYNHLDLNKPVEARFEQLKSMIRELPYEKATSAVYSDIGFLVLGYCLEVIEQKPLLDVWKSLKEKFYSGVSTLDFHPGNITPNPVRFYAPTDRDPWRGKLIQGEVHDQNSWALGGVTAHAGLFGSVDDVSWTGLFLRSQLLGISRIQVRLKTAKIFMNRALPLGRGDWAMGYSMPTPGSSTSGDYFSPYSIGHTGFTGTSFWFDPASDLLVVILSNRVFLGKDLMDFAKLRPQIHNWIIEGLRRA
ncbi:MAG: serine hydrolase domain-containing protein [Bdellovibrio sp.]|jgi:CubicO group peptidase (beta-lactamase class C family)